MSDIPLRFNDIDSICIGDDVSEPFQMYSYSFNPDIYQINNIPHNILRINENIKKEKHMKDWDYYEFSIKQQKRFISKNFSQYLDLYKKYNTQEERSNLFRYLWLYKNGGIFIGSQYKLKKSLQSLLNESPESDLYFIYDYGRCISPNFIISKPSCNFWLEVIEEMEKRQDDEITMEQERIDKNTGKELLTDVCEKTSISYLVLPKDKIFPYNACDKVFDKDSYLIPSGNNNLLNFITCQTSTDSQQTLYINGLIILLFVIMVIIALLTN